MATTEVGVNQESETLTEWKTKTRKELREEIEKHYKELQLVWQAKDLADLEQKMDAQVQEGVQKIFDEWREKQKPLSKEQIEQLVQQEYVDFPVKIKVEQDPDADDPKSTDGYVQQSFVIRELPQSVEKKFYKMFRSKLQNKLPELNALMQKTMDKSVEEKLKAVLELVDEGFDVMAELVKMVLDPPTRKFPKGRLEITAEWVQENISSMRQWNIIQAQVEANKLRDFFSQLSQSGQTIQTMTQPLSYQSLLQRPQ